MGNKRKAHPLDSFATIRSGHLLALLSVAYGDVECMVEMLDHAERTGKFSCTDEDDATAAEIMTMVRDVENLREHIAAAEAALPRAVHRLLQQASRESVVEAAVEAPMTGQAGRDLADLLNGETGQS